MVVDGSFGVVLIVGQRVAGQRACGYCIIMGPSCQEESGSQLPEGAGRWAGVSGGPPSYPNTLRLFIGHTYF